MPSLTRKIWDSMTQKERDLILKVVSTDNILRGFPSFEEWSRNKKRTHVNKTEKTIKIIDSLLIIPIVLLMLVYAQALFDIPYNNDQHYTLWITYAMPKPAVYRVLIPMISQLLVSLGIPGNIVMGSIALASGLGSYWLLRKLFESYGIRIYAGLCWLLVYVLLLNYASPMDWITVFLFLLAYRLLRSDHPRDLVRYLMLFPVIVMHRETAILLVLLYGLLNHKTMSRRTFWISLACQISTFTFHRLAVIKIFSDSPGDAIRLYYDVMGTYLQTPAMIAALFILIGIFSIAYANWNHYDDFIKAAFALFPIQILLHVILGNPFEFRVLAESFPVAFIIVFAGLVIRRSHPHVPIQ
jgi:hypothetical protein